MSNLKAVTFDDDYGKIHSIYGNGIIVDDVDFEHFKKYTLDNEGSLRIAMKEFWNISSNNAEEVVEIIKSSDSSKYIVDNITQNDEYSRVLTCPFTDEFEVFVLISIIMTIKYNIRFSYHISSLPDNFTPEIRAIMFDLMDPWSLTDTERHITEEEFKNIINTVAEELGLDTVDDTHLELVWCE